MTPQSTTTKSHAELLFGQKLKSCLDLLHLDLQGKVESKVKKQSESQDRHIDSESSKKKRLCLLKIIELVQNG